MSTEPEETDYKSTAPEVDSALQSAAEILPHSGKNTGSTVGKLRRSFLVDKLSLISKNVLRQRSKGYGKQSILSPDVGELPPADYYYDADDNAPIGGDEGDSEKSNPYTPIGRNAVEMASRFYVERNLFSYLANANIPTETNYYDDDEVFLSALTRKPVSYIILGKPGVGKTSLAKKLAKKWNLVRIDPESLIEYYRHHDVIHHLRVNEILFDGGSVSDRNVAQLLEARVTELDVLHRGYVLDGFPMVVSEEFPIEDQIDVLNNLTLPPQYIILLQMQDVDLYRRRTEQKFDPKTFTVYIRDQYMKFNTELGSYVRNQNLKSKLAVNESMKSDVADIQDFDSLASGGTGTGASQTNFNEKTKKKESGFGKTNEDDEDFLDASKDFPALTPNVVFRLITRTEDAPILVNDELEQFRDKLYALQGYLEQFDKRKVLELDAYWAPTTLFRRTLEYLECCGERPACIPEQIMRPLEPQLLRRSGAAGEFLGEDDDSEAPCPEDEPPPEIDWESAVRACSVRGQVDPRFRWRASRWYNLCPVALKYGRSIVGKPELVTAFLDNIFFLSSPEAVEQFKFNPRPYLLPKMPTSPIKFFIVGHPLAGKSTFAKELAFLTKSSVVDMNHEMEKRYSIVVHDYLYKKKLKYTLDAKMNVDRDARKAWRKEERARRVSMRKWIEDYIRSIAEAEIMAALEADRARRNAERDEMRKQSEMHAIQYPAYQDGGACQLDDFKSTIKWKDFVEQVHSGKTKWTHQEILELAWHLFHDKKLYYKSYKRKPKHKIITDLGDAGEDGEILVTDLFGEDESEPGEDDDEELGEGDAESVMKMRPPKRRRRRRHCRQIVIKPDNQEEEARRVQEEKEEEYPDSSDLDPDDSEVEESVRMRYPMIPSELVDIVPMPTPVPDHHPLVEDIVNRLLEVDEKYAHSLPNELYVEVLRRACAEAEAKYHLHNSHGPLSGGWVVENLMTDIEKWRSILRTPEVCPDQIFVLKDHSENQKDIYSRLKKIFRSKIPNGKSNRMKELLDELEMLGESMFDVLNPEDDADLLQHSLPVTVSQQFRDSLPHDDLDLPTQGSTTTIMQIMLDAHRERTPDLDDEDELDLLLTQHEKFILNHVMSKMSLANMGVDRSAITTRDLRDYILTDTKYMNPEMTALVRIEQPPPPTSAEKIEQIKEDVRIITEYLRHSRKLGELSYSDEQLLKNKLLYQDDDDDDVNAMRSNVSIAGEDAGEVPPTNENFTPDELKSRSSTQLVVSGNICPEDLTVDERAQCLKDQQDQKIYSPKRKFFMQIRMFDEFWNMAVPVCNEQAVRFWEVGLIDESNAREVGIGYWDQLEGRFALKARRISETEMKEEDEEIQDALIKYGEEEFSNALGKSKDQFPLKKKRSSEISGESGDDEYEFADSDDEDLREDKDILSELEGKPDMYWKTVKKMDALRCFGDTKFYCPVTLTDINLLIKGFAKFACKFKDRLYFCRDEECRQKFVDAPQHYLNFGRPKVAPAPKICITGSPGCGQEEIALDVCRKHQLCYVNFRQRLHELMHARFGRDIGPNKTGFVVDRDVSQRMVSKARRLDDMLPVLTQPQPEDDEEILGEELEADDERKLPRKSFLIDPDESIRGLLTPDHAALKSLGLLDMANLSEFPVGSVTRTEKLTERKWIQLTKVETHIMAFLENGIQLPDEVLDEYIAPLWKEAPFNSAGFILVGFPNTDADMRYLIRNKLYPEMVFLLDCHPLLIRNRLLVDAVDSWHKRKNPSGKKERRPSEVARVRMADDKKNNVVRKPSVGFLYQKEGRPEIQEALMETWTYNDGIAKQITQALKYYHSIYSKGITALKQSLNRHQVDWMPINTDVSLYEAKRILTKTLLPKIKNRSNIIEDTVRLNMKEARDLVNRNYFELSKFHRCCPVEQFKDNTSINLWNAPGVIKTPILYRRYVYFLAGEKNAEEFEENCWTIVNSDASMQPIPSVLVIVGPPKSGKTSLALRLAERLGLVYISGTKMIEDVITHSFASQWGDLLKDFDPNALADGPQPMTLGEEILSYLREGFAVPRFIAYRALDLALMQPKAQYHGVVLDDYPITEEELQELLYRGLVPSTVFKLNILKSEAHERCAQNRKFDYDYTGITPEGNSMIDYGTRIYEDETETTLFWFKHEIQNLVELDGYENKEWIFQQVAEKCKENARKMQEYLVNVMLERPSTLDGTCPLTSQISTRLSNDFGYYCPVALNDAEELIRVTNITDLSEVVEYKGFVYLFSSTNNAKKFMENPQRYTPPLCHRTPPAEVPVACALSEKQFDELKEHWGFLDFDPVRYYDSNNHFKGLQRGSYQYVAAYKSNVYCFISEDTMNKFMKKPERYWSQAIPLKLPRRVEPLHLDRITPYCYLLTKGVLSEVKKAIKLAGEKRPKVPFMSEERCASLFMGYYFKAQNMHAPYEIRQKYRDAMFDMSQIKAKTKKMLGELHGHYGCRMKTFPERLKVGMDKFLRMENQKEQEKVLVPAIPGCILSKAGIIVREDELETQSRFRELKSLMLKAEVCEKVDALELYHQRKMADAEFEELRNLSPHSQEIARKLRRKQKNGKK